MKKFFLFLCFCLSFAVNLNAENVVMPYDYCLNGKYDTRTVTFYDAELINNRVGVSCIGIAAFKSEFYLNPKKAVEFVKILHRATLELKINKLLCESETKIIDGAGFIYDSANVFDKYSGNTYNYDNVYSDLMYTLNEYNIPVVDLIFYYIDDNDNKKTIDFIEFASESDIESLVAAFNIDYVKSKCKSYQNTKYKNKNTLKPRKRHK